VVGSVGLSWVEFFFCFLVELILKDSFESFKAKHDLVGRVLPCLVELPMSSL